MEKVSKENKFKAIGISRLRMGSDGEGVTTLVAAYGCPLRCKYCLNPMCFQPDYKIEEYMMQKEEVSDSKYITIEEMQEAYNKNDKNYTFSNWPDFDIVIEYLKNKRKELII